MITMIDPEKGTTITSTNPIGQLGIPKSTGGRMVLM
jgi:hypothetical protein